MAQSSLDTLSNQALCKLRDEIAEELKRRAESLQRQIDQLGGPTSFANGKHQGERRKGHKIGPKYQGPHGEKWSGRGLKPRWLTIAISEGEQQLEDFLIPLDARPRPRKKVRPKLVLNAPSGKDKSPLKSLIQLAPLITTHTHNAVRMTP